MPRARLFSPLGATRGIAVAIDDEVTVGRGQDQDLAIDDGLISKAHARIFFDAARGSFVLEDLRSTNGTALDGVPVIGRETLDRLHVITFAGRHEFVFSNLEPSAFRPDAPVAERADPITEAVDLGDQGLGPLAVPQALAERISADLPPVERTQAHELPMMIPGNLAAPGAAPPAGALPATVVPEDVAPEDGPPKDGPPEDVPQEDVPAAFAPPAVSAADAGPWAGQASPFVLEVEIPDLGTERFRLGYGENLVGRVKRAEVQLKDPRISRDHAVIIVAATISMRDLGSNNHTFLEDEPIAGEVQIEPGDRLCFGPLAARVIRQEPSPGSFPLVSFPGGPDES